MDVCADHGIGGRKRERKLEVELDRERRENERLLSELAQQSEGGPRSAITRNELLALLNMDSKLAEQDLELVHRQGGAFDMASYGQAQWLFQHGQFQEWLISANPQVLLIDGNMEDHAMSRISPSSHICALLLKTLARTQAVSIHFFCGLHTSWSDPYNGVKGLIRSLIVQLISLFDFDLVFINKRTYRDQLRRHDTGQLCDLFETLLKQVPIYTTIFCVIDGISLFETEQWLEETSFLFYRLKVLTEDDEINATFKLIMISPYASRQVCHQLPSQYFLAIPRALEGERQGLTERQIMLTPRRSAQELNHSEEWIPDADPFDDDPAEFWKDEDSITLT